jgi:hypothetical protein
MPLQFDEQGMVPPQPSGLACWQELPHDVWGMHDTTFTCTTVLIGPETVQLVAVM